MASVTSNIPDEADDEEEEDLYGPPPPDTVPASVLVVRAVDAPDDEHIDNYDMLNDVDDDYTLSEKMVHYVGGISCLNIGGHAKLSLSFMPVPVYPSWQP